MLVPFLILLVIIGIGSGTWFFSQLKSKTDQIESLQEKEKETSFKLDNINTLAIRLQAEKEGLENLLSIERLNSIEQKESLTKQLELLGNEIVNKGSKILKSENQIQLNELLSPLKERLHAFEKEVRDNNKQDIERFSAMQTLVKTLSDQHSKMNTTAQNLVDALRGEQKIQGDWGELALDRILETSGLQKDREYFVQSSFRSEQGKLLRPDVVIQLPDEKQIIIDSKVSLKAFEQYVNESDFEKRKIYLANHILSVRTHIKELSDKDYSSIPNITSPDFVLMFIPLESSFALAVKEEPTLYNQAWDKKIVLVTPSTLLATLKTVESIWKQERQTKNAFLIADQAGKLYDKFVGFVEDLEKVGVKQKDAQQAYDSAMNKLISGNGNLTRSAQKLIDLGVKTKKKLDKKFLDDK